jgi:diguanylate cyclase
MAFRSSDAEEALRWKRKFLDALEEHELREKALSQRIRLLRRGLLGVSLAGDGHDSQLDKQLTELRKSLRNDDREVGLELLLEKIEQSILRLDHEKTHSHVALREAFSSSLAELTQLPLPRNTLRQIKAFSAGLTARLQDPQQHTGLIRQFIQILRDAIQVMVQQEKTRKENTAERGGSFWQRLFSSTPAAEVARPEPDHKPEPPAPAVRNFAEDAAPKQDSGNEPAAEKARPVVEEPEPGQDQLNLSAELAEFEEVDEAIESASNSLALEGEVIRDRSGLAEPAFSYIAGHVEPLLLRILESIHISAESFELADTLRRSIIKGLNWYDFVAVLEEILHILRMAADEQREQFQDFLNGVAESLAQVQSFLEASRQYHERSDYSDGELDAQVRTQVASISRALSAEVTDLPTLKVSLQAQIGEILSSLDGFKAQRNQQTQELATELNEMAEKIAAMEDESRDLRQNLARQQEAASTDTLTELPNRSSYNQRLRDLLKNWQEGPALDRREDDRGLCLAVADVDHFKHINDTYGHLAGDKVLKIIAREMAARLRDKDFVARYGGEEFVILLPDTRPADAEHVLNKLREGISAIPFHFKETKVVITVSFGLVAACREDTAETLFERADNALYSAKQQGRNRVCRLR